MGRAVVPGQMQQTKSFEADHWHPKDEQQMEYKVIKSSRRTFGLEIRGGELLVRVPKAAAKKEIEAFVSRHEKWIRTHLEKNQKRMAELENVEPLTVEELRALADEAAKVIPERVRYYAPIAGVTYGRITIRNQKTKWGSCSSKGNLNFNCLLMLTPPEVIDSVVVHELCHRIEMSHSERFYREVRRVYPEYDKWNRWLKENGAWIMRRNQ